jgi:RimJ/RimL family protein N-acetyltransferase
MAEDANGGPVFPVAPPERIELGEGVALVRFRVDRAAATAASVNESLEHLKPWMAWAQEPATEAALATLFGAAEELWDRRRDFGYSVVEGEEERVVGGCGLHGRLDEHGLEIGYWIHVDRIGNGLATKVSRALTEAAFAIPGIERVRIQCDEANVRSASIPAKLGYALHGVLVPDEGVCEGRSTQVWIVERADWMARRAEVAS